VGHLLFRKIQIKRRFYNPLDFLCRLARREVFCVCSTAHLHRGDAIGMVEMLLFLVSILAVGVI